MSAKRDILKALKEHGFREVPNPLGKRRKHMIYNDGKRTVRVHLGGTMSDGHVRAVLGQIKHGTVRDVKAETRQR